MSQDTVYDLMPEAKRQEAAAGRAKKKKKTL